MNEFDACETAYKNGYSAGFADGQKSAAEAVEKQKAQRPVSKIVESDGLWAEFYCPACGYGLVEGEDHFCQKCGQKLAWEGKK